MADLFERTHECLMVQTPADKVRLTRQLYADWLAGRVALGDTRYQPESIPNPGRPEKPELVSPRSLRQRKLTTDLGRATLLHAIVHIEFNAINLALDAVYRFSTMPKAYFDDWLKVADEEAYHFTILSERLSEMGYEYGAFPAHNGLWEMAVKTEHDIMTRMALVPRVLEARGLDVTPAMQEKLRAAGDDKTASLLDIIFRDEIGHVRIGNDWFKRECELRDRNAEETFKELIRRYMTGQLKGPFNWPARIEAGFTEDEIRKLEAMGCEE